MIFGGAGGINYITSTSTAALSGLVGAGAGDVLTASGAGSEILVAGAGAETLNAANTTGADGLYGGSGADLIFGGSGTNYFIPGSGSETLIGGSGGVGSNGYIFTPAAAARTDLIYNFNVTTDLVGLFGYGANAAQAAYASAAVSGGSTSITLSDNTTIVFEGITNLSQNSILGA